jgi:hypothetical protein
MPAAATAADCAAACCNASAMHAMGREAITTRPCIFSTIENH